MWNFPDQGSNPCPLHWKQGVLTTRALGKSCLCFLTTIFSIQYDEVGSAPKPDQIWLETCRLLAWGKKLVLKFSLVTQSGPTLCHPMECSMPGFPVHHQLPELAQTHVHRVSDAIQPFHPEELIKSYDFKDSLVFQCFNKTPSFYCKGLKLWSHMLCGTAKHKILKKERGYDFMEISPVLVLVRKSSSAGPLIGVESKASVSSVGKMQSPSNAHFHWGKANILKMICKPYTRSASPYPLRPHLWPSLPAHSFPAPPASSHTPALLRPQDLGAPRAVPPQITLTNSHCSKSLLEHHPLNKGSVQFSRSVVSDSLRPHESKHARAPCPSPTPRVHSDSRPFSQWHRFLNMWDLGCIAVVGGRSSSFL